MVDGLEPETGYTTYVYAMDAVSGRAAGTIFRGNFTTMASAVTADLSVKATNIRWLKGSDLAKLDPKYASIADDAYLLADVQTKGNPRTWYINLAVGDMTDPDAFPDETTIEALLMSTTPDKTELRMAVRHEDATFLGIAIDDYGQMGELYREKFSITEEGASPIEDFPADELSEGIAHDARTWHSEQEHQFAQQARLLAPTWAHSGKVSTRNGNITQNIA